MSHKMNPLSSLEKNPFKKRAFRPWKTALNEIVLSHPEATQKITREKT